MPTSEQAIRQAFQKLASQQQDRMERIHKVMAEETEKFKKGLGTMIRQYQDRVQKIYQEIRSESDTFQKNLEKVRKATFQLIEDASLRREKATAVETKKPPKVDDLVNNPPNCTACEFPMVVLKEDQNDGGSILIHFVCPICNLDSKARVSADGTQVEWQNAEAASTGR